MAAKQRVRWADTEEGQKGEKEEELARGSKEQAEGSETKTEIDGTGYGGRRK